MYMQDNVPSHISPFSKKKQQKKKQNKKNKKKLVLLVLINHIYLSTHIDLLLFMCDFS